jgi:3'(2'), 5'-bisphosphate nucleotidase
MEKLNAPEIVSRGSSLKIMLIASGKAHLYPRLAPTMEWDTADAQCIVEEAGGSVVEIGRGQPVRYNKEDLLNPFFVASGRSLGSK